MEISLYLCKTTIISQISDFFSFQISDIEVTYIKIKSCAVTDVGFAEASPTTDGIPQLSYAFGQWWAVRFAAATADGDIFVCNGVWTPPPSPSADGEIKFTETPIIFSKIHHCRISILEWNMNGTKLFTGSLRMIANHE